MLVMAVMTLLCVAGVTFCLRFMVALCKEHERHQIGYSVHRQLSSGESPITELQGRKKPVTHAA
jgi:hypothetical protein